MTNTKHQCSALRRDVGSSCWCVGKLQIGQGGALNGAVEIGTFRKPVVRQHGSKVSLAVQRARRMERLVEPPVLASHSDGRSHVKGQAGCHLHQVLAAFLQQTAVGGVRDRLGHYGRVDDDVVYAGGLNEAIAPGSLDGRH